MNRYIQHLISIANKREQAGPMEDYVFTDKQQAIKKSKEIGMDGDIHTTKLGDGTIVYIPAKTEKQFEDWMTDYLHKLPKAQLELYGRKYMRKDECREAVKLFLLSYGWKTKTNWRS